MLSMMPNLVSKAAGPMRPFECFQDQLDSILDIEGYREGLGISVHLVVS